MAAGRRFLGDFGCLTSGALVNPLESQVVIERPEAAELGGPRDPVVRSVLCDCPLGQSTQPGNDTRLEPRFHHVEDIGPFSRNQSRGLIVFLRHGLSLHHVLFAGRK